MPEIIDNFENLSFNPFSNQENILLNNDFDPDKHLFDENAFLSLNAEYYTVEDIKNKLNSSFDNSDNSFSVIHLNIRSMRKNFESFRLFLAELQYEFSMICSTETWCSDETILSDSNLQLPRAGDAVSILGGPKKNVAHHGWVTKIF